MTDTKKLREAAERVKSVGYTTMGIHVDDMFHVLGEIEALQEKVDGRNRAIVDMTLDHAAEFDRLNAQLRQAKAELDAARGAVEMLYAAAERHAIKRGLDDDHPLRETLSHPTVQAARAK